MESTIYLRSHATGRGVGRSLYTALLEALRATGLHAVIGGIALPPFEEMLLSAFDSRMIEDLDHPQLRKARGCFDVDE